ncbi:hypothetical protein PVK06_023925 [Gossypium arboreum]|uniref:DUF4283 domain-containing protein n=1 Tax=Gossypium arboreum TaxID=29729 RepID=A0ABR0PCM5_GOSAR|nr:hypothetical protein PVK06_023925 [Gossypium arboreum]
MADLWHPFGGILISDLGEKRESFCPISVRIDPSKITFGWDISLCATMRRRITAMSRWLRKADGSVCRNLDKKSGYNKRNGRDDRDMRRIWRDDLERLYPNPNYIPLVPRIEALNSKLLINRIWSMGLKIRP